MKPQIRSMGGQEDNFISVVRLEFGGTESPPTTKRKKKKSTKKSGIRAHQRDRGKQWKQNPEVG